MNEVFFPFQTAELAKETFQQLPNYTGSLYVRSINGMEYFLEQNQNDHGIRVRSHKHTQEQIKNFVPWAN